MNNSFRKMISFAFLVVVGSIALLIPMFTYPRHLLAAPPSSAPLKNLEQSNKKLLTDASIGLSVIYDSSIWVPTLMAENGEHAFPGVSQRMVGFANRNEQALILIASFNNPRGWSAGEWIAKYDYARTAEGIRRTEGHVAGHKAVILEELVQDHQGTPSNLRAYVSIFGRAYLIEYAAKSPDRSVFTELLKQIVLMPPGTYVPSSLSINIKESFASAGFDMPLSDPKTPDGTLVSSCCGVTDAEYNPFPCDNPGNGNCTWWVRYKRTGDNKANLYACTGNANTWDECASQNYPDLIASSPAPGDAVVLTASGTNHVFYIEYMNGNGSYHYSQMDYYAPCPQTYGDSSTTSQRVFIRLSGGSGGPPGYTFCANENQRCNFSGTKDVAYGANGSFYYKYNISGGIDCNNGTFGDPISGVSKGCYTKDSSQTGCNPNSDQVALFEHGGYGGNCKVFNKADYPNPGAMGFANDTASSIKVGGNVKATLCKDDNYNGGCEDFTGDDGNLGDNSIGDNQVSSLKVQDRNSSGGNGVEFCDGTNYGSPCITLTAGKYGNLNDIGWYDRIESLRFKGNYVGNYHVVLSTETNHGGTPGHYERDEANVPDPWRNRTRSIEIYYIDRNNPPGTPALSSPNDWYESNDGTAPNLCWNASSDPEGDNPVQYYAEVFDSAVNGNSGWTTNTCWRPSNLDNQYFGYQWRVKARDNKNKESGWSETRHFTIRQPAPQKPDLRPATLSGYPAPLVPSSIQGTHQTNTLFANARTFIDWHFVNAGNGVAPGGFYVDVYVDNQRLIHYQQPDFGAGQPGGFDDWAETISQPGVHTLKIVTDPDNAVQESDENNNAWEQQFTWVAINGWKGEYFNNPTLDSNPWLTRDDANIDFNWAGGSPDPSLPTDNFSARWTRTAAFECGRYRFNVGVDDGVRLWVNNQKILDEWRDQVANFYPEVDLPAGALPIQVEYYEGSGGAAIQVNWQKLSGCVTPPPAPTLSSPGNGSNNPYDHDLTFLWNAASGASEYLIEWWGGPYSTMQPCGWSSNTSCHIGTVAAGHTYSWHVKARNSAGESGWSDTWTFTIQSQPQPPAAPHDPDPANGASLSYRTALDVSVQGEGEQFRIHVWGNNYDRWRDWDASRSLHLDGLTNQTYNIQAQARNSAGDSPWSAVWTFTIQSQPLGAFSKTNPANGATDQPTNPTLSWGSSSGATSYEYCIDTTNNNVCDSSWNNVGNATSAGLNGLNNGTSYFWQVVAKNSAATTDADAGAWWSFTTQSGSQQLLLNPGFELDANKNGIPDNWGANTKFRRVGKPHIEGSYAARLSATDNKAVTISQKMPNLAGGATYAASCQVNIPATTDAFTFQVQVRWYNSLNKVIGKPVIIGRVFNAKTNGWEFVAGDIVAPAKAKSAQFQFVATSLKTKIHVDDCSFTQR